MAASRETIQPNRTPPNEPHPALLTAEFAESAERIREKAITRLYEDVPHPLRGQRRLSAISTQGCTDVSPLRKNRAAFIRVSSVAHG
jgi:hypothetical protein